MRDLTAGTTTLLARSTTVAGAGGDGDADDLRFGPDADTVVFASRSADLVLDDTNQAGDAFIAHLPPPPED